MSAETSEITRSPDPDEPVVTVDRIERPPMDGPKPSKGVRIAAIAAGIIGFLCFVALPFLPVVQTQSSLHWPQNDSLESVDAPLMAQAPISLSLDVPLSLADELPEGRSLLVGTLPPDSKDPTAEGLQVRRIDGSVDVVVRDRAILTLDEDEVEANRDGVISIRSDHERTEAFVEGAVDSEGEPLRGVVNEDIRPQTVGIYTSLPADGDAAAAVASGLNLDMEIDSRYTSKPTIIKYIVMWLGLLMTVVSLWALRRIDKVDGSAPTPWLRKDAWQIKPLDALVGFILLVWHFIGANTSDDGYIFTMARASDEAGYMANYYRWFGVPESPFGAPYYDLLALMVKVSTASVWMRLPALIAAFAIWFLLSRLIIPRLGKDIAERRVAYWSAAGVLLAFWLPYNNGLRPEPVVALGALLTWVFIERAILTRRLFPAALGVIVATLALSCGPTGLMAVAALLAGLPMLVRIVVDRHEALGGGAKAPLMQTMPFLAAGTAILVAVFGDQTLATVRESTRVRGIVGPSMPWYEEPIRYYWMILQSVDGSFTRRFAVLAALTALAITIAALLRHRTVPGALAAPATRLVFMFVGTMFFLTFTPTKWTHHFGVYAGIGAALAALAAMAISHWAVGSRRNQVLFAGVAIFMLAFSLMGINGWWYVSAYGVPWFDKTVQLNGIEAGNIVMVIAVLTLAAGAVLQFVQEFRGEDRKPSTLAARLRLGTIAASPFAVVSFMVVIFSVLSLGKGFVSQYPAYSVGLGNIRALTGKTCNLAEDVLMETDPNEGYLTPVGGVSLGDSLDPEGNARGFTPNGLPGEMTADAVWVNDGQTNADRSENPDSNWVSGGEGASTDGGFEAEAGVNGSRATLPFGLDAERIPVLGSYSEDVQVPGSLTTSWYELPERSESHPLLVVSAAGRIYHHDINGVRQKGQKLMAEYGRWDGENWVTLHEAEPLDIGPAPTWRNLRFPTADIPEEATAVRLVASDENLAKGEWIALTPPRLAELKPMPEVIDPSVPTIPDWAVAFQFPCQRPFDHFAGVAENPKYRITPDRELKVSSTDTWQSLSAGGVLGMSDAVNESVAVPTYQKDDWNRDWGIVEALQSRPNPDGVRPGPAVIQYEEITRSGLWSPGPMIVEED
ncbi:arabinosyltransferase domain-containing protein [Corynebacterium freneyi]|uniref:arabinosyltransferase domain-containing protein n=1 Tax=Corynebacterium freneyi TaxID=134034 RepID=UPI00254AE3AD|nr:arabinosyltransferase domain-containing protein [Corynebacterium freneyi]MDK8767793.1 arabinosyltransferase domain-containing protein [Corynebacterium freneyi]